MTTLKLMATITAADTEGFTFPLSAGKAYPVGWAVGCNWSQEQSGRAALGLNAVPELSAWDTELFEPWGYGQVSMVAPELESLLAQLGLPAECTPVPPRPAVVAAGVTVQPCSTLPSVTRVMLPPPEADLPALVTERVYSPVLPEAPITPPEMEVQPNFETQPLPERTGHLKHGSMYWARLASDEMREEMRSGDEGSVAAAKHALDAAGAWHVPDAAGAVVAAGAGHALNAVDAVGAAGAGHVLDAGDTVDAFPCPSMPDEVSLCPPGTVPGNAEAWATGVPPALMGTAKFHLALNTTTVRSGAALSLALEEEVCSYLDGLEPYHLVSVPESAALRATVRAAVRAALRSELKQATGPTDTPSISIKTQPAVTLRTVELDPLFADSLVDGGSLSLGQVQLSTVDPAVASLVPRSNPNYIFARTTLYELLLYLTEPSHDALFLSGPTGCGKTSAVFEVAARLGWPLESVTLSQKSEVSDLIGAHILDHGQLRFSYGPLTRAMLYGEILLLNEIDLMSPGELAALNDVLEGRALTISANNGEVVKPHPCFRVVATANSKGQGDESGSYHGVKLQNQAFLDRWRFCEVGYPTSAQERLMLERACPELNPDFRDGILRFASEVRLGHSCGLDNRVLLQRLEQAELRLLASTVQDLKDHAQALKDLLDQGVSLPEDTIAAAQEELSASGGAELNPFFDELLAHHSLLTQHDGTRDPLNAHAAANELFAHCEEQMPGFEQLHESSCTELERAQALEQVAASGAGEATARLSAPFSSRSLLRITALYYGHPELSVQEAISLGFASRLPPAEYEYLLRLSYDIFGYGSNFNALPHRVSDAAAYQQEKAHLLKYNLPKVQLHLARLQKCQADVLAAKPQAKAKTKRKVSA